MPKERNPSSPRSKPTEDPPLVLPGQLPLFQPCGYRATSGRRRLVCVLELGHPGHHYAGPSVAHVARVDRRLKGAR